MGVDIGQDGWVGEGCVVAVLILVCATEIGYSPRSYPLPLQLLGFPGSSRSPVDYLVVLRFSSFLASKS